LNVFLLSTTVAFLSLPNLPERVVPLLRGNLYPAAEGSERALN
jgi:hypothetical protein